MFLRIRSSRAWMLSAACAILIAAVLAAPHAIAQDAAKNVVCKVNGQDITEKQMLDEIDVMLKRTRQPVDPRMLPQMKGFLYSRALNNLQEKALLVGVAKEKNITVNDADIEERYKELRANFQSEEEFEKILKSNGLTLETLKEQMKEDMIYVKVLDKEVKDPAAPTDEEIKKFFDENKAQMGQKEQVTASHILINTENASDADKTKAKEKLQKIRKDILDKKITFADAAKANSDCPSKARGGDLGSFGRGQMVPEFDKVAFDTKVGEISDIVETQFGYHIIQVNDRQDAKEAALDDMKDKIKEYLVQEGKQKVRQEYVQKLRDEAKIETLVDESAWKEKYAPQQPEQTDDGSIQISPENLKP